MFLFKWCETREYSPRQLEHWLHTVQKHKAPIEFWLIENQGKVLFLTNEDFSSHFPGSRALPLKIKKPRLALPPRFFIKQPKGPLLPIKRYTQFEDRLEKTRLFPLNLLIKTLANTKSSFAYFQFKPVAESTRRRALKKAKKTHFEPERHFDQWESKGWFTFTLRCLLGPLIRRCLPTHTEKQVQEQTESLHEREDPRRAVLDKLSRPLFKGQIRLSHAFHEYFHGFTLPYLGALALSRKTKKLILSAEELASLLAPPNTKNSASHLYTEPTAYLPPPRQYPLKITEEDRKRHLYLVGKTGMGKSTLLLQIFQEDLKKDHPIVLMDPHGDLIEDALTLISPERQKDLIFLDPSETESPLAINPVELLPHENPTLKASGLLNIFQALSQGSWGPRLEYILRNALLALLLAKNNTLLDLPRLLTDQTYAQKLLAQVRDHELRRFFFEEFFPQDPKNRQEQISPILNKVGPLLTSPLLRNIFGQPKTRFHFDRAFAENKIVLIPLSKGRLGEDHSRMLGMIFLSMIESALLKRADQPKEKRNCVALTLDEFQNFATKTLITLLSESRKYGLALTLANQYLTQIPEELTDAILGNVGSLFVFRTSFKDAETLAPTLGLTEEDLTQLAPFQSYAKLLKNQIPQPLFRWDIPKIETPPQTNPLESLKHRSLIPFTRPKELVEQKILERYSKRNVKHAQ